MTVTLSPQLASPAAMDEAGRYVVNPNWVAEQKLDGHRVMIVGPGTLGPVALTRNGSSYTRQIPTAVRNWRITTGFDSSQIILDGELIRDTYWVFDILFANGGLDGSTQADRRVVLEEFFRMFPDAPFKLVPQARTAVEKEALLLRAAAESLEGVVFKRLDAVYGRGIRAPHWVKVKFTQTADVVVIALRDDGKESATLGIYPRNSTKTIEVGRCSLIGKPKVQIHDVVEVKYLYVPDAAKPRLYQPTLVRVRTDKVPADCDGSDFKVTNKSVLATL